jgi:hypothetical protein
MVTVHIYYLFVVYIMTISSSGCTALNDREINGGRGREREREKAVEGSGLGLV